MAADIILILVIVAGAVVPGHFFSTDGFGTDSYFDHIIDSSIERLQHIYEGFYLNAKIQEPEPYGFGRAVEGTIVFNGIRSFSRPKDKYGHKAPTQSKPLENGDIELLSTFRFGYINGSGNFSGVDRNGEGKQYPFEFHMMPVEVEVTFLLAKRPTAKRLEFKFVKPPVYDFLKSYYFLNVSLLVTNQSQTAFFTIFQDLYTIIHGKQVQTVKRHDVYFDKILDKVFKRENGNVNPIKYVYSSIRSVANDKISTKLDLTAYGLRSLERVAQIDFMDEINGDFDIRAQITFGNVSGTAHVVGRIPDYIFSDGFNFTATPAVVEALFYLPHNKSHQEVTFHFVNKPSYTIKNARDDLRSIIGKVIEHHGPALYGAEIHHLLNETQNEVFRKVEG